MRLTFYAIRLYKLFLSNKKKYLYIPLGLYWLLIFVLTTIPGSHIPKLFGISDKIKHFGAYLVLAFLLNFALFLQKKYKNITKNSHLFTIIIVAFYGLFDEIHQIFIPGRSFDWWDLLADLLGSLFGILLVKIMLKISNEKEDDFVELS